MLVTVNTHPSLSLTQPNRRIYLFCLVQIHRFIRTQNRFRFTIYDSAKPNWLTLFRYVGCIRCVQRKEDELLRMAFFLTELIRCNLLLFFAKQISNLECFGCSGVSTSWPSVDLCKFAFVIIPNLMVERLCSIAEAEYPSICVYLHFIAFQCDFRCDLRYAQYSTGKWWIASNGNG